MNVMITASSECSCFIRAIKHCGGRSRSWVIYESGKVRLRCLSTAEETAEGGRGPPELRGCRCSARCQGKAEQIFPALSGQGGS